MTNAQSLAAFSRWPSTSNIVDIASRRTIAQTPEESWLPVTKRLEELIRLERGWDGYAGSPVSFVNATFALSMLKSICDSQTPAPQIVPGSSGDLQVEWHTFRGDVELHVRTPNDVHAWRVRSSGVEEELSLANDFSEIVVWLKELVEPSIAVKAAAA
jgi:hypothetical protein